MRVRVVRALFMLYGAVFDVCALARAAATASRAAERVSLVPLLDAIGANSAS